MIGIYTYAVASFPAQSFVNCSVVQGRSHEYHLLASASPSLHTLRSRLARPTHRPPRRIKIKLAPAPAGRRPRRRRADRPTTNIRARMSAG